MFQLQYMYDSAYVLYRYWLMFKLDFKCQPTEVCHTQKPLIPYTDTIY